MPTTRGWAVLGFASGLLALWVLLGERELLATGLVMTVAFLIGLAWVRLGDPAIPISREIQPEWVQEGDDVVVTLRLTNLRRVSLLWLRASDTVRNLGHSTVTVARIPGRKAITVPYRVHTTRRGVFRVGPVRLSISDPLGLVQRTAVGGPTDTLVVYPRPDPLRGFPIVRGRDPSIQASRPEFSARGGEDFFTIREYRHGDDLRRVHWRTTARRDELMIRQFETPWQSRGVVVLDTRASVYDPDTFESAVTGAASAYLHLAGMGFELDALIGVDHVRSTDPSPSGRVLEALAGVTPSDALDLLAVSTRLRRKFIGGALVVVTGTLDDDLGRAVAALGPDFGSVLVMSASREPLGRLPAIRTPIAGAACPPDGSWTEAWIRMQGRSWASV